MKRRLLTGLLILCAAAFAAVTTTPMLFTTGNVSDSATHAAPRCSTAALDWGALPILGLSWQAWGDSGNVYYVGYRWADGTGHYDAGIDTILCCTLRVATPTRATASRRTRQISRQISEYGQFLLMADTTTSAAHTTWTVKFDSLDFLWQDSLPKTHF